MLVHLSEEVGHTYATIMKDKSAALRSVIKVMQIYFYFFSHFYFLYFVNSYSYFLRIDYLFSDFSYNFSTLCHFYYRQSIFVLTPFTLV